MLHLWRGRAAEEAGVTGGDGEPCPQRARQLQQWIDRFGAVGCGAVVLDGFPGLCTHWVQQLRVPDGVRLGVRLQPDPADQANDDAAGAALVLTPALSTLLRNGVLLFDSCAAGHLAPKPTCLALALRAAGHGLGKAEEQRLEKVEHLRRELLDRGI
jgi:hypothetical protein